jgi:hypothetical protein
MQIKSCRLELLRKVGASEGPRPQSRIELFAKWMADGYQQ